MEKRIYSTKQDADKAAEIIRQKGWPDAECKAIPEGSGWIIRTHPAWCNCDYCATLYTDNVFRVV